MSFPLGALKRLGSREALKSEEKMRLWMDFGCLAPAVRIINEKAMEFASPKWGNRPDHIHG
jgi:hypothetical protein